MKKLYEVEVTRTNITPRAFYMYCKKQLEKKGYYLTDWVEYESWANKCNHTPYHRDDHKDWDEPQSEVNKNMPYDFQTCLLGNYNIILEFEFDTNTHGYGYFYIIEWDR